MIFITDGLDLGLPAHVSRTSRVGQNGSPFVLAGAALHRTCMMRQLQRNHPNKEKKTLKIRREIKWPDKIKDDQSKQSY